MGVPCKMPAIPGKAVCRYHSPDPEDVARHRDMSAKGGEAVRQAFKPGATASPYTIEPLNSVEDIASCDLTTSAGLSKYLAMALRHLARVPFGTNVANAMAQLVTAQRNVVETSEIERRLAELEAGRPSSIRAA